ncbi:MAG: hypothetical protein ACPG88_03400, partial [Porticoccaceae bacterium]
MADSRVKGKAAVFLVAFFVQTSGVANHTPAVVTEDDLLTDIHMVSSVTHMNQTLDKTPAAVTIIDRRTIEASAAVDILDLFRLVPGFRAYYINANS